jgi:hypothetical protein
MEPNRKLFPGHFSFILHGTLLGAGCLQCCEGSQFPVLKLGVQGQVFVVWSLLDLKLTSLLLEPTQEPDIGTSLPDTKLKL